MGVTEKRRNLENLVIMGGWILLLLSCALPSWRVLEAVNLPGARIMRVNMGAGDWLGYLCAYYYFPCWAPNFVIALSPFALLVKNVRATMVCAVVAWLAFMSSLIFIILERIGHGFLNTDGIAESRLLFGCYLWLIAYAIIAFGLTARWRRIRSESAAGADAKSCPTSASVAAQKEEAGSAGY
jgi:hypothetical protein